MTQATSPSALTGVAASSGSSQSLIEQVARRFGVSPFRQFADIFRLRGGRTRLNVKEYYEFELYRPSLSAAEKREFVGERGSYALNQRLAPSGLTNMRGFLADKVGLTAMIQHLGLPTTQTQAAFSPTRGFGALPTLRNTDDIKAFLTGPARYPLFGKPISGAQARGTVSIPRVEGEAAHLSNGDVVALDKLAAEVAANTESGYVFQDMVAVHPEIAAISGSKTVSTVRVVTVNEDDTPRVLYTAWKLPSANAMSDNFWQKGSMISLVDPASGVVQKVRFGSGPDTLWIETHPVTGAPLVGITLPSWQSVLDLACAAHAIVPDNGILGWDIALTPEGALLIECNENTGHALYQLASGRGVLNADFTPAFERVLARNARMASAFTAKKKAYEKAKARV